MEIVKVPSCREMVVIEPRQDGKGGPFGVQRCAVQREYAQAISCKLSMYNGKVYILLKWTANYLLR